MRTNLSQRRLAIDAAKETLLGRRAERELFEEPREALRESRFFFARFGERQLQRVAQQHRIFRPMQFTTANVERFCRRKQFRTAQRRDESSEVTSTAATRESRLIRKTNGQHLLPVRIAYDYAVRSYSNGFSSSRQSMSPSVARFSSPFHLFELAGRDR
jgi:hypothetical protein